MKHTPGPWAWQAQDESFKIASERHQPDNHVWWTWAADNTQMEVDGSEIDMGRLKLIWAD